MIFCSEVTKRLVLMEFKIAPERLIALEKGVSTAFAVDEDGVYANVTLLDANHCPGAVMFLFEGPFGCVLHTGDFKYSPTMYKSLSDALNGVRVDVAFVDNTYATSTARTVLSTSDTVDRVVNIIRNAPSASKIYIGLHKIGKEEILVGLTRALHVRVRVSYRRWQRLRAMDLEHTDWFVRNDESTEDEAYDIEIIHSRGLTKEFIDAQRAKMEGTTIIGISITGMFGPTQTNDTNMFYRVPYSSHTCRDDLRLFMHKLNPACVRASSIMSAEGKAALLALCRRPPHTIDDATSDRLRFRRYRVSAGLATRHSRRRRTEHDTERALKVVSDDNTVTAAVEALPVAKTTVLSKRPHEISVNQKRRRRRRLSRISRTLARRMSINSQRETRRPHKEPEVIPCVVKSET